MGWEWEKAGRMLRSDLVWPSVYQIGVSVLVKILMNKQDLPSPQPRQTWLEPLSSPFPLPKQTNKQKRFIMSTKPLKKIKRGTQWRARTMAKVHRLEMLYFYLCKWTRIKDKYNLPFYSAWEINIKAHTVLQATSQHWTLKEHGINKNPRKVVAGNRKRKWSGVGWARFA